MRIEVLLLQSKAFEEQGDRRHGILQSCSRRHARDVALMLELKARVSFIVAPFEADSQLYYLAKKNTSISSLLIQIFLRGTPQSCSNGTNPDRPGVGDEIDLSTLPAAQLDLVNFRHFLACAFSLDATISIQWEAWAW